MSMIPEGTHGHIAEHAALTSKIIICAIPSAKRRMFHSRALDYTFLMQAYALTCMAVEIERLKELPCPSTLAYNKHQAARNDPLDTPQLQNHSLQRIYHEEMTWTWLLLSINSLAGVAKLSLARKIEAAIIGSPARPRHAPSCSMIHKFSKLEGRRTWSAIKLAR
ncbi:hypothetical protein HL42_3958 [Trichophyton rubrum]|nr:hypothetical protein HL42_3958 [Trichophyton rubrum]